MPDPAGGAKSGNKKNGVGSDTPSFLDRRSKWDFDSDMPPDLAQFIVDALRAVYAPPVSNPNGPWAAHPTILNFLRDLNGVPVNADGYPTADDVTTMYY